MAKRGTTTDNLVRDEDGNRAGTPEQWLKREEMRISNTAESMVKHIQKIRARQNGNASI